MRNTFQDPLGHVADYQWELNHATEQSFGRKRDVQGAMNVAGTQLITNQSDAQPLTLVYQGSILTRTQYEAMWHWEAMCESQTIYFTDFTGDSYEVVITDFEPVRVAGRNRRGGTDAPMWYWTYTLTMTVVAVRGGTLHDAGITG